VVVSVGGHSQRYPVVLRHIIHHPQELVVDQTPEGAELRVTDSTGTTTLIRLLRPADGDDSRGS
jgi:hypothetical protein